MESLPEKKIKRASAEAGLHDSKSEKSAKTTAVDKRTFAVDEKIKRLAQKISSYQKNLAGEISVSQSATSKLLCVVTNDVISGKRKMEENGNPELFIISVGVLQVCEPAGYLNSPYEPAQHVPPPKRCFTDKDGKPLENCKPVQLMKVERALMQTDGPPCKFLTFRSYESHPKPALNTKCRGSPTNVVGAIHAGLPLNFTAYADNCKISKFGSTEVAAEGISLVKQHSVVVLGIRIKNKQKCDQGFGVSLSTIEVLENYHACMLGLYSNIPVYSPFTEIGKQTENILTAKRFTSCMDSDLSFIRNCFRQEQKFETVSERPLVSIEMKDSSANVKIFTSASNDGLQILIEDEKNVYHNKTMHIHISSGYFSNRTRSSGFWWLQQFYEWIIGTRACNIIVVHDQYRFKQAEGVRGLTAFIGINYNDIFGAVGSKKTNFTPSHVSSLQAKTKRMIDPEIMMEDTSPRYSAWTVHEDTMLGLTYAIVVDNTGCKNAKRVAGSEDDTEQNECVFSQLYDGMAPSRAVHLSYLIVMNSKEVMSAVPVGIRDMKNPSGAANDLSSMVELPMDVDIAEIFE